MCNHSDCNVYPYYGVAPHECCWRKLGGFKENPLGTSTIDPLDNWPDNFFAEIDSNIDIVQQLSWGLCGVYVCPKCKSGFKAKGLLWDAKRIREALAA